MKKEERVLLYKQAISKWGVQSQIFMFFEEIAELQKAICKYDRVTNSSSIDNITEEFADVQILLEQIQIIFKLVKTKIEKIKHKKLLKFKKLLNGEY